MQKISAVLTAIALSLSSLSGAQAQFPSGAQAQQLQDLKVSGALDILHPGGIDQVENNRVYVRSFETMLYGPVDHLFDGQLTLSGHAEEGEMKLDLHEGYFSTSKLLPRTRMKAGKFFLGVGRLNQFHQHDWPFVTAPKVQRQFFQAGANAFEAEGAIDSGAEVSVLLPLPFYLDLTFGVTNGDCFGHCHKIGKRPPRPLLYLHPTTFIELENGSGLLIGASYLELKEANGRKLSLTGLDATYKNRQGKTLKHLVQSELWHQSQDFDDAASQTAAGAYVFHQYGVNANWTAGLRLDGFTELNKSFATGDKRGNFDYAVVPVVTYKASEFSTVRLSYTHEVATLQGAGDSLDRRFEAQLIYFLGAHPAHDF